MLTKDRARHIIIFKGNTPNGNPKYGVTTVSKDLANNSSPNVFTSWDNYNIEETFKDFKTRMDKKMYGITVYEDLSIIVKKLKEEYGNNTEIYKL